VVGVPAGRSAAPDVFVPNRQYVLFNRTVSMPPWAIVMVWPLSVSVAVTAWAAVDVTVVTAGPPEGAALLAAQPARTSPPDARTIAASNRPSAFITVPFPLP
jgi:hypothetical protein